jgi:hypothetical protein
MACVARVAPPELIVIDKDRARSALLLDDREQSAKRRLGA